MAKYKVVITDREYADIDNEKRILTAIDAEVQDYQYKDSDDIVKAAHDADAIMVQYAKITADIIDKLENCKIITRYGIGYDNIDVEAATRKGIFVCNVADYCKDEVSSHAVAMMLDISTKLSAYNRWTHENKWSGAPLIRHSLRNQVVGIISFGRIAQCFAAKAAAFCDNIMAYDAFMPASEIESRGVKAAGFDEIIEKADYISIHCPLNDDTYHMFDRSVFRRMKDSAVLINAARGPVVDGKALVWALQNKEIAGAALDVLENEPPADNDPILTMDNVIITPHVAWYSEESQQLLQQIPAEDIARALTGQIPLNLVNKEVLKR